MSMNSVILTGRAGRDPEVRYFEDGNTVAAFSMAVDRNSRNDDGPDWFDVEFWGKSAQASADNVRNGSRIGVEGRLEQQRWVDRKTGEKRSKIVIKGFRLELLDSKADAQARQQAGASTAAPQPVAAGSWDQSAPTWQSRSAGGDDVPF